MMISALVVVLVVVGSCEEEEEQTISGRIQALRDNHLNARTATVAEAAIVIRLNSRCKWRVYYSNV